MISVTGTARRVLVMSGMVVGSVVVLTGCITADDIAPTPTATPAPTITITAPPLPAVTVTAEPIPVEPEPEPEVTQEPVETEPSPPSPTEPIVITLPTDSGVRGAATGSVESDSSGIPYKYTVAAGDIAVEICTRFNRYIWQLGDAGGQALASPQLIQPGDVILLTANERPDGYVIPAQ